MSARKKKAIVDVAEAPAPVATVTAYKGFDKKWQCRGFQFELGKTYEHTGKVKACESGFHACEHPLNVFEYYAPAFSRYAEVTLAGDMSRHGSDTKVAAAKITINVELSIGDLVKRAWDYVWSRATLEEGSQATGYQGAASATGYRGAASATGEQGAASATGKHSVALAAGYKGTASGSDGCALFLVERDKQGAILNVWAGIVGRDSIKPNVSYWLKDGKPLEATP